MSRPRPSLRRLFFALQPDATGRGEIAALRGRVSTDDGRWVHRDDLHLTLLFVGGVFDEQVEVIADAGGIAAAPIALALDRIGLWRRSGILWYGPSKTPAALNELVEELKGRLQKPMGSSGLKPDARPYRAHLTLARKVRRIAHHTPIPAMPFVFNEFLLMEALSLPAPPRYRILRRYPLNQTQ